MKIWSILIFVSSNLYWIPLIIRTRYWLPSVIYYKHWLYARCWLLYAREKYDPLDIFTQLHLIIYHVYTVDVVVIGSDTYTICCLYTWYKLPAIIFYHLIPYFPEAVNTYNHVSCISGAVLCRPSGDNICSATGSWVKTRTYTTTPW